MSETPDARDPDTLFLLVVRYCVPIAEVLPLLDEHRSWLDAQYARSRFVVSGPQVPLEGGAIVARDVSAAELQRLIATDPFVQAGVATYETIEFRPNRGPFVAALLGNIGEPAARGRESA